MTAIAWAIFVAAVCYSDANVVNEDNPEKGSRARAFAFGIGMAMLVVTTIREWLR